MNTVTVHHGDCLDVLRGMPDNSTDAVITDPPYGLAEHKPATILAAMTAWAAGDREHVPDGRGFMGRAWDGFVPPPAVWDECLRVLKPGGHLLCFAGARTVDLMGLSIRLAGFEIRDTITWHYGSGFPKSLNVGAAIMKGQGLDPLEDEWTPEAEQWRGHGTALKPASEPIIVARKPLTGTVASTVLAHGTGALNVDACRVGTASASDDAAYRAKCASVVGLDSNRNGAAYSEWGGVRSDSASTQGRWPTNVVLTHGETCGDVCGDDVCPVVELDAQSGVTRDGTAIKRNRTGEQNAHGIYGSHVRGPDGDQTFGGQGGASRFFPTFRYQAKAPTRERPKVDGVAHPTVKPLALMAWLVRLVTPPGGVVLDPFAGSGTTLQAARDEGMAAVGIEREASYLPLIAHRLGVELGALIAEDGSAA